MNNQKWIVQIAMIFFVCLGLMIYIFFTCTIAIKDFLDEYKNVLPYILIPLCCIAILISYGFRLTLNDIVDKEIMNMYRDKIKK